MADEEFDIYGDDALALESEEPAASSENDIRNRMGGTDVEAAVKHVVFHELHNSGKSQGSAYIIFEDQASATAAKESLEQVTHKDNHWQVRFAPVQPNAYKFPGGRGGGGIHQNHMPRNNMPYQKFGNPGYNMMGMNPMMGMPYGGMMPNPGMMGPMGCK
ncbi:hypothetical protein IWQ60_005832 [Tieghemiomyces parasiticus]|uniref:RRM domain-containing protein n=1 Tax=Tieghemiomyces parasiticus TaxID=78921 RepID=A0A9W8DYI4_9FUNG|nr:hypothetical protein IWQ60_005832 [Tieghemiomyces parasiticus]